MGARFRFSISHRVSSAAWTAGVVGAALIVLQFGFAATGDEGKATGRKPGRPVSPRDVVTSQHEIRMDRRGARAMLARAPEYGAGRGIDAAWGAGTETLSDTVPGWQDLGLSGGTVNSIAFSPANPDLALAGLGFLSQSLHRSVDGGATWSVVPLYTGDVNDVEFARDGTPWVAADSGLFRGTADGASWTRVPPYLVGMTEIAFDPLDPDRLWLGRSADYSAPPAALWVSIDGGIHWNNVTPAPLGYLSCTGIAVDLNDSATVMVSFTDSIIGGQVWRTRDGGGTWSRSLGLPSRPMNDVVHDGTRFLVAGGHEFGFQPVGVYATSNTGASWTALHDNTWPSHFVRDLEVDPGRPGTILAATARGLVRSVTGGASWTSGAEGTDGISLNSASISPGDSGRILLGGESRGVLRSIDGGERFASSSTGIHALGVVDVAANPNDPMEIAAAFQGLNSGGVYSTLDGGRSWTVEALPPTRFDALEFGPDGTLYVASTGPSSTATEGVYRRNPGGTWTALGPRGGPLYETDIYDIRVANAHPNVIVIGGFDLSAFRPTIWISFDAGASWDVVFSGTNRPFAGDSVSDIEIVEDGTDLNMLAAYTGIGAVLTSSTGGTNWVQLPNGIPSYVRGLGLAHSRAQPDSFYLATERGTYRSDDAGITWRPTGDPGGFTSLVSVPDDAGVVVGARNWVPSVMRSVDGGAVFSAFDDGLEGIGASKVAWRSGACPGFLTATPAGIYFRAVDTTAPEIHVSLDREILWPPNHRMATIHATVEVTDNCDASPTFVLASVVAVEADGEVVDAADDIDADPGVPCVDFRLRAERSGPGTGRDYRITYAATDLSGNSAETTVVVRVPHDRSGGSAAKPGR